MAKLWRRPTKDEPKTPPVREADLSTLRIERPSLIFLSGFFTTDEKPEYTRASLRAMDDVLAARPRDASPVDVYCWSHGGLKDAFNLAAYTVRPGSACSPPVKKLAAGLIMPLVVKDFKLDAKGNATGTPLPLDEAKKNLRNITFFGYSAGCITAQECFNASLKMMQQSGYAEKDARDILSEVVYIGAGVVSRPGREKDRFTSLFLEATNDRIVRFKNRLWAPLRVIFSRFAPRLKVQPLSGRAAIITAAVSKRGYETKQRNGKTVKEKIRGMIPRWMLVKSLHELPRYMTQDEELSPFAKMVHYGIANAVARTGPVDPIRLLDPPPGTDEKTAAAYREKISKAVVKPKRR